MMEKENEMFCPKCGMQNPDDGRFCTNCGARLLAAEMYEEGLNAGGTDRVDAQPDDAQPGDGPDYDGSAADGQPYSPNAGYGSGYDGSAADGQPGYTNAGRGQDADRKGGGSKPPHPERAPLSKKTKGLLGGICAAVVVLIILIIVLVISIKPTINLDDYIEITSEGYNTIGTVTVELDTDALAADYEEKLKDGYASSSILEDMIGNALSALDSQIYTQAFISACVSYSVDADSGLSNGDTVTLTWDCDDDTALSLYGVKLKYSEQTVTVSGLEEVDTFDPFAYIEVSFSGVSPDGEADYAETTSDLDIMEDLYFSFDESSGLSNGDTVTLSIDSDYGYYDDGEDAYGDVAEYCAATYGIIPSPLEKTYTVEGLDTYAETLSDIADSGLSELRSEADTCFEEENDIEDSDTDEVLKTLKYMGAYLLTTKDTDGSYGTYNELYLVYKAKIRNHYGTYKQLNTVYSYVRYTNVSIGTDGSLHADDYDIPSDEITFDSGISSGWFSTMSWYYYGYETLDELYDEAIRDQLDDYTIDGSVEDGNGQTVKQTDSSDTKKNNSSDASGTSTSFTNGQIFPDSSRVELTSSQIKSLTDSELRYAINEIYARNGYIFTKEKWINYYSQFDWYNGTIEDMNEVTDSFNSTERKNVNKLKKEEDSRD